MITCYMTSSFGECPAVHSDSAHSRYYPVFRVGGSWALPFGRHEWSSTDAIRKSDRHGSGHCCCCSRRVKAFRTGRTGFSSKTASQIFCSSSLSHRHYQQPRRAPCHNIAFAKANSSGTITLATWKSCHRIRVQAHIKPKHDYQTIKDSRIY